MVLMSVRSSGSGSTNQSDPGAATMNTPTSLVRRPSHTLTACAHCGSKQVTELSMTVADGSQLNLASCHRCEGRTWKDGQTVLELSEVLVRARKQA